MSYALESRIECTTRRPQTVNDGAQQKIADKTHKDKARDSLLFFLFLVAGKGLELFLVLGVLLSFTSRSRHD